MSTAVTATGEKPLTSAALRELSARSNLPGIVRAVSHYGDDRSGRDGPTSSGASLAREASPRGEGQCE